MSIAGTNPPVMDMSPDHRRDEIITILSLGLSRFIDSRAADPQELSESGENGLELSVETRLSVARG